MSAPQKRSPWLYVSIALGIACALLWRSAVSQPVPQLAACESQRYLDELQMCEQRLQACKVERTRECSP